MSSTVKNIVAKATGRTTLQTTHLGRDGPEITRMGIGLMGLSSFYGVKKPDAERMRFLDAVYDSGERFWDTADMYGDSEDLIGRWFKANPGKRENIFLATKFANRRHDDGSFSCSTTPEYAREACERSLKRLGVSHFDLYYIHRVDGKTPIEKTMQALVTLKNEGKIHRIGISEASATTIRRAHAVHPLSACQVEYSPFALDIEQPANSVLQTCRALGIAIIAYSPLGRGMLSGKYRSPDDFEEGDWRRDAPRFSSENFGKNLVLVDKLNVIAERKGCTPSQLTLAWLMSQGDDVVPIPGTTSLDRLKENLGALEVKLTDAEKQEIRKLSEEAEVHGERYAVTSLLFGDTPELEA
ncbi:putative aldo-keto reductase [Myriangium duriaei CBS 260.36]|uniref:Aldo-keto reductase n=1 Tax=Myriangium duriaei CBS 260.36 TaxID=1168546 RepID=A0A9P4J8T3_9PEZI|nr:putative aldo-keto reductase [Myriangium duriaei CBS 260.36]